MNKLSGILGVLALAGLTGCATEGYVNSQTDPLAERLGKLEAAISQLNGANDANAAAAKGAGDKAQQALDLANKTAVDARKADSDARSAEAAATRAEAAAARAEKAAGAAETAAAEARQGAQKSEKIFELEQKK